MACGDSIDEIGTIFDRAGVEPGSRLDRLGESGQPDRIGFGYNSFDPAGGVEVEVGEQIGTGRAETQADRGERGRSCDRPEYQKFHRENSTGRSRKNRRAMVRPSGPINRFSPTDYSAFSILVGVMTFLPSFSSTSPVTLVSTVPVQIPLDLW